MKEKFSTIKKKGTGEIIISKCRVASSFFLRLKGLLGNKSISPNEGMLFPKCNSIHTLFMRFPIDCIFLNDNNAVVKICENLSPWKVCVEPKASKVLEMAAGTITRQNLRKDEVLEIGPLT